MADEEIVVPGTHVGSTSDYISGPGTYAVNSTIYASVVGWKQVTRASTGQKTLSVRLMKQEAEVPAIGAVVLCRVSKINARMAHADILMVENSTTFRQPIPGVIKARDIRSFEQDAIEVHNSYLPGDIVRAVVISLGDSRSYYLSTAREDLGVVAAKGRAGKPMAPVSWECMQCPVTGEREYRKVAKIDPAEAAIVDATAANGALARSSAAAPAVATAAAAGAAMSDMDTVTKKEK